MKNILFLILLMIIFSGCSSTADNSGKKEAKVRLPTEWTNEMEFRAYKGGGMLPESETIVIRSDSAWLENWYDQARNKYYIEFTREERNLILKKIRELNFITMKMEEHPVIYDKGSLNMSLRWKNNYFNFSEGATESISQKDAKNYFILYDFVSAFISRKLSSQSKAFTIMLDPSVFNANADVYFSFQSAQFQYNSKEEGVKEKLIFDLLPGEHEAQLNLVNPDHLKNNTPMYYANYRLSIDTRKYNQVKFYLRDQTILIDTVFTQK